MDEDLENPSQVRVQVKGWPDLAIFHEKALKQPTRSNQRVANLYPMIMVMDFLSSMPIPARLNAILAQKCPKLAKILRKN